MLEFAVKDRLSTALHDFGRARLRLSPFAPRKEVFMTELSRCESRQIIGSLLAIRVLARQVPRPHKIAKAFSSMFSVKPGETCADGHRASRSRTLPPADLDPDSAKFYEVVDGQVVENPPMGARESILASFLQDLMGPVSPGRIGLGRVVTETLFLH